MSNFLAISTVTATLRHVLQTALVVDDLSATVTTLRPERLADQAQNAGVNIYLYQVTPNIALRNADLPTRHADGRALQRSQVALDLHYLLTFYGEEGELSPQRMLGTVVSVLHSQSLLTREMIRSAIESAPESPYLSGSDLAEQMESVKFTLLPFDLQGLHSLWSLFFPTPYYLSIAYKASVVLIDGKEIPQPALPVRDLQFSVVPFTGPVIEEVVSEQGKTEPIVADTTMLIRGVHLSGDSTVVRMGDVEVSPQDVSDRQIRLTLPEDLESGVQGVQVVPQFGLESNVAAFVLRPTITEAQVSDATDVTVSLRPKIGQDQRAVVLLNELSADNPAAYSFIAPPRDADADSITISISGVKPATYLVRVRVDGAESPLTVTNNQYTGPRVTIP